MVNASESALGWPTKKSFDEFLSLFILDHQELAADLRVRFQIILHARTHYVGKSQSCMVSK